MNRVIKFRGKRLDNGEWVYGYYSCNILFGHFITDRTGEQFQVDPETVGQFTGLLDNNGKELCDGDIIKRQTGYVFIEQKKFFALGGKNDAQAYGYDYHPNDEIIGNTTDNPELITS